LLALSKAQNFRVTSETLSSSAHHPNNNIMMTTPLFFLLCWLFHIALSASSDSSSSSSHRRQLIVNGERAPPGRFPYFVSLERYGAGVLIAPDIILTAGHTKPKHSDHVQPHIGTYHYKRKDELAEDDIVVVDIVEMHRHENFTRLGDDEFQWDFTILLINDTITSHPYAKLNAWNEIPFPEQDTLTILGLGVLSESTDERPKVLQQVNVHAIPNSECEQRQDPDRDMTFEGRIMESHMCTWSDPTNDKDACGYDSGGPIVMMGDSPDQDVVVGLVSWGEGCADEVFPGVNARVSSVYDWIRDLVCDLSQDPPKDFHCFPEQEQEEETVLETADRTILKWILILGGIALVAVMCYTRSRCCVASTAKKYDNGKLRHYQPVKGSDDDDDHYFKPLERGDTEQMADSSFFGDGSTCSSPEQSPQSSSSSSGGSGRPRANGRHFRHMSTDSSTGSSYQNGMELADMMGHHPGGDSDSV
jgi:secreted trypsin-like serine protease